MKVYFEIDEDQRTFEGRTQAANRLKQLLIEKWVEFVSRPEDADLIHFHSSGIAQSFRAYRLKKSLKKPTIYSLYSLCETEPLGHFVHHFKQISLFGKRKTSFILSASALAPLRLRAFLLRYLDSVVVPSDYTKRKLFLNTQVIHLGVDTTKFGQKKQEAGQKLKVCYIGHPSVYKGLNDFLYASLLFPNGTETYAYVSRTSKKIESTVRRINPRIHLAGFASSIVDVYHSMDVIVIPHRSKLGSVANPLVLLEAMACGKAIVTTNFKFIREIADGCALIVPPHSPKAIARAVSEFRDKKLRQTLGDAARRRVCESYDEVLTVAQYLKLYEACV